MKRAWTKSWPCVSLYLAIASLATASSSAGARPAGLPPQAILRTNETLLAGLRPGRDTFAAAEKRFKTKNLVVSQDARIKEWRDECSGRAIRVELDDKSVIQSITITMLVSNQGKCGNRISDFLDPKNWETGHGLRIGNSQDRIIEIYGEPNSSGPAVKNEQETELLFYQFDWAGPEAPQVMEVLCARDTGRVQEITLAFPSL